MSFGVSVGDIFAVTRLANTIRQRLVNAPKQFKAISEEVRSLSIILQDVEVIVPEKQLTSQQRNDLVEVVEKCFANLKQLEQALERYQSLDYSATESGGKPKRIWKKIKWDQKDFEWYQRQITTSITILHTFIGKLSSQATFTILDGVSQVHERLDHQQNQIILDWLTMTDYGSQHSDILNQRQEGTGQWFLDSNEFQSWLSRNKQTLFCPGIPGAGKTVLAAIVVDFLKTRFQNDSPAFAIGYIYCNFRQQHVQTAINLLSSLLKQLAQQNPAILDSLKDLYNRHISERTRPSCKDISSILQSISFDQSKLFIIIDALDELQISQEERAKFLSEIFAFQSKTSANIFATSRYIPDVVSQFEGCPSVEIRATDEDVQKYLDSHISQLRPRILRDYSLQNEIKTQIVQAAKGMFLLAKLLLDSLADKTTPREVRRALEELPRGSEALDQSYDEAMQRIRNQKAGFRQLAEQVLEWIVCAKIPLPTMALQHALAVEDGDTELGEDNFQDIDEMVSVCAGLIIVDEQSKIVRLVHYTTQQYFEAKRVERFPNAEINLTRTCITYLMFDGLEVCSSETKEVLDSMLQKYALLSYAARYWGDHARAASTEATVLTLNLLEHDVKLRRTLQIAKLLPMLGGRFYKAKLPCNGTTALHVAAYFGLMDATKALLEIGHDPNTRNADGRTPLSYAAEMGHENVVQVLLKDDLINQDLGDISSNTLIQLVVKTRHQDADKQLKARGVDPHSEDGIGLTPLSYAAVNGYEKIVRIMLERGLDPDTKIPEV